MDAPASSVHTLFYSPFMGFDETPKPLKIDDLQSFYILVSAQDSLLAAENRCQKVVHRSKVVSKDEPFTAL